MASKRAVKLPTQYRLYLLGGFRLERDGESVTLARAKAKPLLAYLALFPQEHRREKVAADLWLDSTDADARLSLRVTLNALRNEISPDLVLADRETLQLNPQFPLWTDAREIYDLRFLISDLNNLNPGEIIHLKSKIENYRGDLLPELYDEWLIPERERLREQFLDIALRGVEIARGASDYANAIKIAQHVLKIDRANETAHQHLIFCFAASGNRAAALNQFQECARALREELGVEPSPETRALLERVTQDETRAKSPAAALTNLPKPLTSFVGREREMREIRGLLGGAGSEERGGRVSPPSSLLTLVGAGGSGKTRLAIQVARELLDEYKHGVWFADLAPLADAALVPQVVAKTIGIPETPNESLMDALANYLRRRKVLLILDNCEHLVNACAQLASHLLAECEQLQTLATSREALNIGGEVVYHVPTLDMPTTDGGRLSAEAVRNKHYPAVRLFIERAQTAKPDFRLTEQNADAVIEICRRLDGMPLAIELAAARVKLLSPQEIAERLDQRFDVLSGGARGVLPRQQTLRALLDWSFDLLSEHERVLFRRLAVFAGGWTLEAAEEICADEMLPKQKLVLWMSGLVEKSLVLVDSSNDATRYSFLETIREYAREKLFSANEGDELQTRHLDFFISLAEQAEPELFGRHQIRTEERLDRDLDNFRAALHWAFGSRQNDAAIRLTGALGHFWYLRGLGFEGNQWLTRALELQSERTEPRSRARVFSGAGTLAYVFGEYKRAMELHSWALELYQALQDGWHIAFALNNLAVQFGQQGFSVRAAELFAAALERAERNKHAYLVGVIAMNYGSLQENEKNLEGAEALFSKAYESAQMEGSELTRAWIALNLGRLETRLGRSNHARQLFEDAAQLIETHQLVFLKSAMAVAYGFLLVSLDERDTALQLYREGLEASLQLGDFSDSVAILGGLGVLCAEREDWETAVQFWGCAEQSRKMSGEGRSLADVPLYTESLQAARDILGDARFVQIWQKGEKMQWDDLAERILRGEFERV